MKPLIDKIQMKYGCCGVESHEDWFLSKWAGKRCCSSDSLQCSSTDQYGISANNQDTSDDVPFSCCSDAIGIPCIHHQLRQDSHYVVFSQ
ncbi:Hypothetical protein NTJ_09942 [Nesidiocoris tenuis]|uniref:Uncharacterized protein n=1 Tax=Nesidiocoris tenuis TaxID=355587 RepID=A0ABN7AYP6_9HEMI|nr:Hypothetical protein NTJ_09942 [Nesidiocoris tenuis]